MFNFIKKLFCKNDMKSDTELLDVVQNSPIFQHKINILKSKLLANDLADRASIKRGFTVIFVCGGYCGLSKIVHKALNNIATNDKCFVVMFDTNLRLNDIVVKWINCDYNMQFINTRDIREKINIESFCECMFQRYLPDYVIAFSENSIIDAMCKIAPQRKIRKFYGDNPDCRELIQNFEPSARF